MSFAEIGNYIVSKGIPLRLCSYQWRGNDRGVVPPDYYIEVPCGKCEGCLRKMRSAWAFRLINEMLDWPENSFITLSIDDSHLLSDNSAIRISNGRVVSPKKAIQLYIDRLRKDLGYRPRYFFVPELGDKEKYTGRLHFHGIFFNTSQETLSFSLQRSKWPYGNTFVGYVKEKTCNYVAKYLFKQYDCSFKPWILCSNGIGASYVTAKSRRFHINAFQFQDYVSFRGSLYPLHPYYVNKLYDEDVKLCRMINRYSEDGFYYLNGVKYYDYRKYYFARRSYYRLTLSARTSLPLFRKTLDLFTDLLKETYGDLYLSQAGYF